MRLWIMQACLTIYYHFRQENQKSGMSNFQRLFTHKHELQMIENGLQLIHLSKFVWAKMGWNGVEWYRMRWRKLKVSLDVHRVI